MRWISEDGEPIHQLPGSPGSTMHERCVRSRGDSLGLGNTIVDLPEVDSDGDVLDLFHHSCIICGRSVRATKVILSSELNHFL
jgi:hypothetical protein